MATARGIISTTGSDTSGEPSDTSTDTPANHVETATSSAVAIEPPPGDRVATAVNITIDVIDGELNT